MDVEGRKKMVDKNLDIHLDLRNYGCLNSWNCHKFLLGRLILLWNVIDIEEI